MKKHPFKSTIAWNSILVVVVLLSAFVIPYFPPSWGRIPIRIGFTLIFLAAVFSLEKYRGYILYISLAAFVLEWISGILNLQVVSYASRAINILFFFLVVATLIRQMATSRIVTARVILASISGYLLLGIIFSVVVNAIMQNDPGAFNINQTGTSSPEGNQHSSDSMYFGFVTLATLGYGDIVPLKAYSRSLATLISISGQLYIATIVAMLVGKFAVQRDSQKEI